MKEEKSKTDVKTKATEIALPYNTDVVILDKILNDLKTTGTEGINSETLWAHIAQTKNLNRRYTLNLAKFLNLIDTDGSKVWLTNLGRSFGLLSGDKKNILLAQNLPEKYMTMFKWIKMSPTQEMLANELKIQYINTFGQLTSQLLLDRSISSFLQYCQYIGLLKYTGKGRGAKAILTDLGKRAFDTQIEETKDATKIEPEKAQDKEVSLPNEAYYPIRIITRDSPPFYWDLRTEADLTVIDSVINSIKQRWKDKNKSTGDGNP